MGLATPFSIVFGHRGAFIPGVIRALLSYNWVFQQLEQVEKRYQIQVKNMLMNVLFFGSFSLSEHRSQVRIGHGDAELKKVADSRQLWWTAVVADQEISTFFTAFTGAQSTFIHSYPRTYTEINLLKLCQQMFACLTPFDLSCRKIVPEEDNLLLTIGLRFSSCKVG